MNGMEELSRILALADNLNGDDPRHNFIRLTWQPASEARDAKQVLEIEIKAGEKWIHIPIYVNLNGKRRADAELHMTQAIRKLEEAINA